MYIQFIRLSDVYKEEPAIRLARLYMESNESSLAYESFHIILTKNPNKVQEILWLGELYRELNKTDDALNLFKRTIKKNPNNYAAYGELALYHLDNNDSKEAERIFQVVLEIDPMHLIKIYEHIGIYYQKKSQFEKSNEIFDRVAEIRKKYYNPNTEENYLELYRIINGKGIKLIAMQYPALSIQELNDIFRRNEEVTFVSNELNFKNALMNYSYDKLFVDIFAGSFGHASKKGNLLIAENVANTILNMTSVSSN
jgi:tetratricopeptide (TPR) repeat protein